MSYVLSGTIVVLALLWFTPMDDVVMATGIVEPGDKIYIDAPMRRAVKEILAYEGARVKQGQPVVLLDDTDLVSNVVTAQDEVNRAQADLDRARAKVEHIRAQPLPEEVRMAEARERSARINLEAERQRVGRSDSLWARNYITASDIEASRTRYELSRSEYEIAVETLNAVRQGPSPAQIREAEAEVSAVEASLVMAQHRLELDQDTLRRATLRAPKDGVVVRVDLHPGMVADQGATVMVLAAHQSPVLRAWVKEMNVWKVKQGQPVEILSNVFSDRERFMSRGEVAQTYPYGVSDGGERTFGVMVKFTESVIPPPLGSTADARIIVGRRAILKILLGIEDDLDQYIRQDGSHPPEVEGDERAGPAIR